MPTESEHSARREAGRKIREQLFGTASLEKGRGASDFLAPDVGDLFDEALWGVIWARPGLDITTKSLCTIVALLSLERYSYAKSHIEGARNLGVPIETLAAAIVQLTFYVGLPVVHSGLALVAEVYGLNVTPPEASPPKAP